MNDETMYENDARWDWLYPHEFIGGFCSVETDIMPIFFALGAPILLLGAFIGWVGDRCLLGSGLSGVVLDLPAG